MASTSETGHAKNVANLEELISFCIGYGGSYNPVKASLQIAALQGLRSTAQTNLNNVTNFNTNLINAVNARQIAFDPLKGLSTRIINALDATDATDELVKDAKSINRKIQGARKPSGKKTDPDLPTPPIPPAPPVPPASPDPTPIPPSPPVDTKQISVSQQSYDQLLAHFNALIALVASEPTFTPNEVALQVATLTTQATDLATKNTAVIDATTNLSNARIARNATLYADHTGLCDIALEVKKYVKSVFGATSEEYGQVSKIKFTKPR